MQKLVIDTNVLVSSLLTNGYPARIMYDIVFVKKVIFCLSEEIWEEYVAVLSREKFSKYVSFKKHADIVLSRLEELAVRFSPTIKLSVIRDQSDNKFLELAIFAHADFLITGNTNDFALITYQDGRIITPKEYWEMYGTNLTILHSLN